MRRAAAMVLLGTFVLTLLTGCLGAKEIDNWAYVYTIGVDKGVANKLRFTFQVSTLKGQSGGAGGGGGAAQSGSQVTDITVDAPTFYTAVNMVNASLAKTLNFM
ncbi:MAG TPA: Ger(x)C family spore germination protein, partial [Bacillota bacterium]|nr:Ger(x)C family spore germination protein [Bacillota bacterium]